jgi:hypothetical protein
MTSVRRPIMLLSLALGLAILGLLALASRPGTTHARATGTGAAAGAFQYWGDTVTLDEASRQAVFPVVMPHTDVFDTKTLRTTQIDPGGFVLTLTFPPVSSQKQDDSLQPEIRIIEKPWEGGVPPDKEFPSEVQHLSDNGAELCSVGDVIGMCEPMLRDQSGAPNGSAYMDFSVGGMDYQVFGGDSIDDLMPLAENVVKIAEATPSVMQYKYDPKAIAQSG